MKNLYIKWLNSNFVITLVFIITTWVNFNQERWLKQDVISDDVSHYYSYLPAFFYERDLSLVFLKDERNSSEEQHYYAPNKTPAGGNVIKMTSGMAIGFLPFFGMAHIYSQIRGLPLNGFTVPFHLAIQFSTLIYYILGLIFLQKLLRNYAEEKILALCFFIICFGTNVFYYLTVKAGNVHTFTFFLNSAFTYFSWKWFQNFKIKDIVIAAVFLALSTLTRPINIVFILVPLLFGVLSLSDLYKNLKIFWLYKGQILISVFVFILIMIPQLMYWKLVSGYYFFNSYVDEHFYFENPHIIDGLFSFRKGWLLYTPVMFFSLMGIFYLKKFMEAYLSAVLILLPVYLYITFSWWCWWYGGSFGQRALIDLYPLLCIPLCAILLQISRLKKDRRNVIFAGLALLISLNLFQTVQAKYNIIHYDSMTKENYFRVFLTATGKPDREKYLRHPDYKKALRGEDEY